MRTLLVGLLTLLIVTPAWAVGPVRNQTGQLEWTAPATNADGTPLADLAGYEVLLGRNPGETILTRDVSLPTPPQPPIAPRNSGVGLGTLSLTDGQWYARVRAYDLAGNRGAVSNEAPFVYDTVAPGAPTGLTIP